MQKKIIKYQFYTLFVLTTLNLLYFYYKDSLPDNYFSISYDNSSINSFSYYFVTALANFGYWCGIWVTLSFIIFSILNTLVLTKKNDPKNNFVIAALLPLSLLVSYLIIPESLGEGLFFLLHDNLTIFSILFSLILFSSALFYLVSEKHFFKTCKFIAHQFIVFWEMLKNIEFKNLNTKNFDIKATLLNLSEKIQNIFKRTSSDESINPEGFKKLKITPQASPAPKIQVTHTPELFDEEEEFEDIDEEEIEASESDDEFEEHSNEDDADENDDFVDSEIDDELNDELEEVESPFSAKPKKENKFFDSAELINCIAPKNQSSHINDPDNSYFETIARAIEEKLKEFNISAQIINVLKGPVVDTFELELGPGVKVAGVTNRTDDLSLALMGAPIRMVYPMKGKSTIGIEVPRNPRDVIYLDEVLSSPVFNNPSYKLPIAMGKDAYGDPAIIDLASTPHLLVAGTTGAGKSVFINTLLVSLIIRFSPKQLRLIMLDPKQLELALYQRLPHLIMPVVTDPEIASISLMWAIEEMERRYSLLKDFGVKNIEGFNKKFKISATDLTCKVNKYYPDAEIEDFELPYIVVVVDEFADLMLSKSGKAIETSISRLAAKARASGIHIVLATQRPSTDIITGVIKANFPTRVSFRVFTNIDSRVILDGVGAEKLLGKGDMLFKQGIDILRMHSAYVNEDEIEALVDKLATLPTEYIGDAMEFIQNNGSVDNETDGLSMDGESGVIKDDKYEAAVQCVAMHRIASASFLQRRLGVGYNRAANLVEEMERRGIVGPSQGSKPRKVLIPPPADSAP